MNVLFTCAGRRNYLLRYFKRALNGAGKVFATDMSQIAPALYEADKSFTVPAVDSAEYIDVLLDICQKYSVDLVLSLNDIELPLLARNRSKFREIGTELLVSSPDVVNICFDKLETCDFLKNNGFSCPATFLTLVDAESALDCGEVNFPLFVKPRWGSASLQIYKVHSKAELRLAFNLAKIQLQKTFLKVNDENVNRCLLIQESLVGDEYGIDVLNDRDGNVRDVFVKKKLGMRAGETDKAELAQIEELTALGQRIGSNLGHIGNLDCDVFYDGSSASILELNPRFGGGYPFSDMFGANYPEIILQWYKGGEVTADKGNVAKSVVAKCDRLIFVN